MQKIKMEVVNVASFQIKEKKYGKKTDQQKFYNLEAIEIICNIS